MMTHVIVNNHRTPSRTPHFVSTKYFDFFSKVKWFYGKKWEGKSEYSVVIFSNVKWFYDKEKNLEAKSVSQ